MVHGYVSLASVLKMSEAHFFLFWYSKTFCDGLKALKDTLAWAENEAMHTFHQANIAWKTHHRKHTYNLNTTLWKELQLIQEVLSSKKVAQ